MAAQLSRMKGSLWRSLARWMAWAKSSFPVPLSPTRRTGRVHLGGPLSHLPELLHDGAFAHDVAAAVLGGPKVCEFLLVELDLGFQDVELVRQDLDILDVLEHDLAEDGGELPVDEDRDPLDDLVAAHDLVGVVDLGDACLGDDVHPGILDDVRRVFADLRLRVHPEELPVGVAEEDDVPVRVGDENAAEDVVEHTLVELDFFEKLLDVGRFQRSLLLMGKPA